MKKLTFPLILASALLAATPALALAQAGQAGAAQRRAPGIDGPRVGQGAIAVLDQERRGAETVTGAKELEPLGAEREGLAVGNREPGALAGPRALEEGQALRAGNELTVLRSPDSAGDRHEANVAGAPGIAPDRGITQVNPVAPAHRFGPARRPPLGARFGARSRNGRHTDMSAKPVLVLVSESTPPMTCTRGTP